MGPRVTITDVAREAGVSVATVSKVLNDRYGVASATSARVRSVIADLGYESSLVARSLRSHRTHVLGILVAEFEPFSAEILKGAATALGDSEYELLAYSAGRHRDRAGWEQRSLSRLSGTLVDGAVLVTPTVTDIHAGVPVVAIDPHAGPSALPTVDADSFAGAVTATTHLVQLGHRRIAHVAGRADLESSRLREAGYRQALADAGIEVDPRLVVPGDYRREGSRSAAAALLASDDPPTAVFAANDLSALAVVEVALEAGLRVPDDLSVVGFDDVPEAVGSVPALTTVHQPLHEMGRLALEMLVALVEDRPDAGAGPAHRRLATTLVRRASTGPAPRR